MHLSLQFPSILFSRYTPGAGSEGKPAIYIAASPMSPLKPGNCYFEIEVLNPGEDGHISK